MGRGALWTAVRAARDGDATLLHRQAHSLKSSARDVGATSLAARAAALEARASGGALANAGKEVSSVAAEFAAAREALVKFVRRLGGSETGWTDPAA